MRQIKKNLNNNDLQTSRVTNVATSSVYNTIYLIITTICPFFLRSLMLRQLGTEWTGLHSVFLTFVGLLNISELGFGQVMTYFLYRPLAENDPLHVNAILATMKKVYGIISISIIVIGIGIDIVIPFISGETFIKPIDQRTCFFLYILATSLSYGINFEIKCLLNALQRSYLYLKINIITCIVTYSAQAIILLVLRSYFLYVLVLVIQVIINGVMYRYISKAHYPEYQTGGKIDHNEWGDIKKKVGSMIGHQLDERLLNSIDNVIISFYLGLSVVAIYSNYFYVLMAVSLLLSGFSGAALPAIGNAVVTENKRSNEYRFNCVFLLNAFAAGWATICMYCIYQNFITLWVGEYLFDMDMVGLFCIYFYFSQIRSSVRLFKDASGLWYNDRYKPYVAMLVDFVLDVVLIRFIGVKGAIVSSIVCVSLIEGPWEAIVVFRDYFKTSAKSYIIHLLKYTTINLILLFVCILITDNLTVNNSCVLICIKFVICSVICVIVYYVIFRNSEYFKTWRGYAEKLIRSKTNDNRQD